MRSMRKSNLADSRGQVLIEYVLLLVIVVVLYSSMMGFITKRDSGGDPDNSGFLIKAWSTMISTIGQDYADDTDP